MSEVALDHAVLETLVGAFADGELAGDDARAVQEHLRTCARCQRELALQQGLSRALAQEPAREASPVLRRRIEQLGPPAWRVRTFLSSRPWAAPAAAALVVIGIAAGTVLLRDRPGDGSTPIAEIPVLRDAVADCRRVMARNFPRKADLHAVGEGLQFRVRALDRPDAELFSTWKTTLAGVPAAGLAYHWRGIVVVQYAIPAELIRRQPQVDQALRRTGFYAASDQGQGILAFLADGSGTLLVGDAAPEVLRQLIL
jgi:anti-sigma factor RsiW